MRLIKGIGSAGAKAYGKCMRMPSKPDFKLDEQIDDTKISEEIARYERAINDLEDEYIGQIDLLDKESKNRELLEVHKMLLRDITLVDSIKTKINSCYSAESAVGLACDEQIAILESLDNEYLRQRALDISDIKLRMLFKLTGLEFIDVTKIDEEVILVGEDIPPSVMANVNPSFVKGIVTELGSKTSHTAILAQCMDIVAVMGCGSDIYDIQSDEYIFADGLSGELMYSLSDVEQLDAKQSVVKYIEYRKHLSSYIDMETKTLDGKRVLLCGNIMNAEMCKGIVESKGDGCGLFRTEFLYMDRPDKPGEEEQFTIYKTVLESLDNRPVIIRTLDIGGDKEVECLDLPKEANPFMGYRAIRICLDDLELFKTQLRAILRASVYGKAHIMFPMIANIKEIQKAKQVLRECMMELDSEGISYDKDIEVGIMIEVPSIATVADMAIEEVDFFSIGSNDLTGYTVAADRMNSKISYLYSHFDPAVLRLVKSSIDACNKADKLSGVCGEMAGDILAVPLLIGFGLKEFSVSPVNILKIRKLISLVDSNKAKRAVDKVMKMIDKDQIIDFIRNEFEQEFNQLMECGK